MSNIEKIRQEIERRMEELERDKYINIDAKACRHSELKFLERFIDSLPEEKLSEDLEEAADKHIRKVVDVAGHPGWDWETQDIKDAFIAGAEWQKKQAR